MLHLWIWVVLIITQSHSAPINQQQPSFFNRLLSCFGHSTLNHPKQAENLPSLQPKIVPSPQSEIIISPKITPSSQSEIVTRRPSEIISNPLPFKGMDYAHYQAMFNYYAESDPVEGFFHIPQLLTLYEMKPLKMQVVINEQISFLRFPKVKPFISEIILKLAQSTAIYDYLLLSSIVKNPDISLFSGDHGHGAQRKAYKLNLEKFVMGFMRCIYAVQHPNGLGGHRLFTLRLELAKDLMNLSPVETFIKNLNDLFLNLKLDTSGKSYSVLMGMTMFESIKKERLDLLKVMLSNSQFLKTCTSLNLGLAFALAVGVNDIRYLQEILLHEEFLQLADSNWLGVSFKEAMMLDFTDFFQEMLKSSLFLKYAHSKWLAGVFKFGINLGLPWVDELKNSRDFMNAIKEVLVSDKDLIRMGLEMDLE